MPVSLSTRGAPAQAIQFDAWYSDGLLQIRSLQQQFGRDLFPLANNVERLGHGDEQPGLGMTILQVGFDRSTAHAQGSSYLGPCLERLGYCEWNGEHHGIQWRLTKETLSDRQLLIDLSERF